MAILFLVYADFVQVLYQQPVAKQKEGGYKEINEQYRNWRKLAKTHGIHANVEHQHEEERIEYCCYAPKCFLKTRKPNDSVVGFEDIEQRSIGN